MLKIKYIFPLLLLVVAACTQPQAPVEDMGKQFFGREHEAVDSAQHETYPANSEKYKTGYTREVEKTPVPAVGVSDLPPPNPHNNSNNSTPFKSATSAPAVAITPVKTANNSKFIWPVAGGKVVSHFSNESNDGINIAAGDGEPIWAAANGMVVYAGNELKGYGNMVILKHDNGIMTAYANTSKIAVKKNDYVKQGDIIAYVGTSGGLKTPQLHFAVREGKTPVDPEKYLPATNG